MRHFVFLFTVAALVASCVPKTQKELAIVVPTPPALMTDGAQVAEYMADHYWDNMPFTDTAYIDKEVTLQTFSNYAYMLINMPLPVAEKSIDKTMNLARADSTMYAYFAKMSEDHFNDPNSPYRNDNIYMVVLNNIIAWPGTDELHKVRPRGQLEQLMRNMVGDQAADFGITLKDGSTMNMYDIAAPYTLLYFAEPDCPICAELTEGLLASSMMERMVKGGQMKVAMIYPERNIELWREREPDMPAQWLHGYSEGMREGTLYDIRALPSLYLLDADKRVLLKDAVYAAQIEQYFENKEKL